MLLTQQIASKIGVKEQQVSNVLALMHEGAGIPFISRYRKEQTGHLDELQLVKIQGLEQFFIQLEKRKTTIIAAIEEQGKLHPDLLKSIKEAQEINELEDIYLPYKKKRTTKADVARKNGLEPLAKRIMGQTSSDLTFLARPFMNKELPTVEAVLDSVAHIIVEWIGQDIYIRKRLRQLFMRKALLSSKKLKKEDVEQKYTAYYDWAEPLSRCASHRFLAIYRADKEGILKIHILPDKKEALGLIERHFLKNKTGAVELFVAKCIKEAYRLVIAPALETEMKAWAKERADEQAIEVFAQNLRQLFMTAPIGNKRVLAIDPGYKSGCKMVCLDEKGDLLSNVNIYPHAPQNEKKQAGKRVLSWVEQYKIEAIAIGNGTASRETEYFIKNLKFKTDIKIYVVSEDGASIYSASSVAREEFPDYDVTVRGAVSIGRRLMDPVAELVKIDPKSLGVGQYQYEVNQKKLKHQLDFVVESVVNRIGVNLNTASPYLLRYVSGIGEKMAERIVDYRLKKGLFKSREDLKKVSGVGDKLFEQAAGFLKVPQSSQILDTTRIHPERYTLVKKIASDKGVKLEDLMGNSNLIQEINWEQYVDETVGLATLQDIAKELSAKGADPRKATKILEFSKEVRTIDDLKEGLILPGIVTNITNFGAFVDIGIKENGLLHLSQMADGFVDNPNQYVHLHQHLELKVIAVDKERKRIQLSLKGV